MYESVVPSTNEAHGFLGCHKLSYALEATSTCTGPPWLIQAQADRSIDHKSSEHQRLFELQVALAGRL